MSLKPIRKTRRHHSRRARFEQSGGWNWNYKKPSWNPSTRQLKALAIVFIIIAGVIGADQISKALFPNSPLSGVQKYDPFTLLWNGTTTGAGATSTTSLTVQKQQASAPTTDSTVNTPMANGDSIRYMEAFCDNQFPTSFILAQIDFTVKRVGNPTGTVTGLIWNGGAAFGAGNGNCAFNLLGLSTFGSPISAASIPTAYTVESWTGSFQISGSNHDWAFGVIFSCTTCDGSNYIQGGIVSVGGLAPENGYLIHNPPGGADDHCASGACPSAYKYQYTLWTGGCPFGYQCLFSTIDGTGNIQLNAKPQGPSTLDSFHPTPSTSMYNAGNLSLNLPSSFFAQTFTITGASWQIASVQFLMNQTNPWTGAWVAQIWNLNGTAGTNGSPKGTLPNSGLFPAGSALAVSTPFTGPLTSTATATSFSFPSSPLLSPGSYAVSLTDNGTIAPNAMPMSGIGTGVANTLVSFQFGDGAPAYAGHNVYLPHTGQLVRTTKAFWFTIIGAAASSVAITSSPIDVSTSASKELFFFETWHNATNLQTTAPWGWYVTTNATLPTQANYNPLNDPSVAMANVVYPNAGASSKNYYEYMAKTGSNQNNAQGLLLSSGAGTDPYPSCPQTSSLYMCAGAEIGASSTNFFAISTTLNYTGTGANSANGGFSLFCVDTTPTQDPPTSAFCSSSTQTPTLSPCSGSQNICASTVLPFLNMQSGPYYLGFWASSGQNATILFGTSNSGAAAQRANSVWYWVPNPPAQASPPATINEGGFFGPLIKALLGIGIWIAANVLAFFPWLAGVLGPVLSQAFAILETFFVNVFNAIGNALGLGNVGTILQSLIGQFIIFFSSQVPTLFTNLPSVFSRFFDTLTIVFPWLPNALTTAQSILLFGIKGVAFIPTIVSFAFMFVSGAFATYLIAFWFIYTGDDSLAGILALFETTEFLVFGIGIRYIAIAFNYAEDIITATIGLIPKPLVQMVAHKIPRLPIVEVNARFVWPGGSMSEIRNGNLFTVACWITGLLFLDFYETASPALPGSIGFLLPAALSSLTPMSGFIPLLELMTAFTWGAAFLVVPIGWFANAVDMGSLPFESAVGTKVSGGFGGLKLSPGEKHFQGRLEKAIAKRNPISEPKERPSQEGVG